MNDNTRATQMDEIRQAVTAIYQRDGEVKPSTLVDESRPKDSPTHKCFEWSDKKAGEAYRLIQARKYIRAVTIVCDEKPEQLVHVPSITRNEGAYKPATVIAETPSEYERALSDAIARLAAARRAVHALETAAKAIAEWDDRTVLISQIAKSLDTLDGLISRVH